ncbi:ATP-binding protein [Myroides sp. LJL116]
MKNSLSIKLKIFTLYLILLTTVILSGAYIYREAKTFTEPETAIQQENNKAFLVSTMMNNIFNSESYARNAILTNNKKDIHLYYAELDTIVGQIELLQQGISDKVVLDKLDTVKDLLLKKKTSFQELLVARAAIEDQNNYDAAFLEIYDIRQEIEKNIEPIIVQTTQKEKRGALARLFKGDHTDTIKTTVNYPSIADSLISSMQKIILSTQDKIKGQQNILYQRELQLIDQNKIITDQLNDILLGVEKNIIALSFQKINESKSHISTASTNIAYIGGSALFVIIILGFIIIKDINQTQENRLALERLNIEKEELLRSKTMLFATVTHDLQTPLGSLLGFSDLLEQSLLNQKQTQYIANIKSSGKYIANLIQDLTDFSKLENNKITISYTNTNIKDLLQSSCFPLLVMANNKSIELTWDIEPDLDQEFYVDGYRIKQILTNLISNAVKFTQQGSVQIKASKKDMDLIIEVKDTGIGIEQDQLDQIFKEFTQANAGIEKKFGGTGLGLNISKRLVELLKGSIKVESILSKGSTFTISLPLQEKIDAKPKDLELNLLAKDLFKNHRVLIVDDDKIQLQLMQEIFTPLFKETILINDSTKVIPALEKQKVDIILSDIQMPQLDGFELVQKIRSTTAFCDIPIIALSGKRDLNPLDFTSAGFTASHNKPLHLNILLLIIAKALKIEAQLQEIEDKKETQILPNSTSSTMYSVEDLQKFIGQDLEAIQKILLIFMESTSENLLDLSYAEQELDLTMVSNIAHKMLPMFKQLKVIEVIPYLEDLEQRPSDLEKQNKLQSHIQHLNKSIALLIKQIKTDYF